MSGAVHTPPRCEGMAQNCAHYAGGCVQCRGLSYTKGPWRAAGEHVFSVNGRLTVTRVDYGTEDERLANARLIAAAPEMLEALCNISALARKAIDNGSSNANYHHFEGFARSAIAKAKGIAA